MDNKETPKEVSEYFSKLGKKSWEVRKKKIIEKIKEENK